MQCTYAKNFFPLITKATHLSPQTLEPFSLIDHVLSDLPMTSNSAIIDFHISHHMPIMSIFPHMLLNSICTIKFMGFSHANFKVLGRNIDNILPQIDPLLIQNLFVTWLTQNLNSYFPIKIKRISQKTLNSLWMSQDLLRLINEKHQLLQQLKHA